MTDSEPATIILVASGSFVFALAAIAIFIRFIKGAGVTGLKYKDLSLTMSPGAPASGSDSAAGSNRQEKCGNSADLARTAILSFLPEAERDMDRLHVSQESIQSFIHREIAGHPRMFDKAFSCLPLTHNDLVIMFSWDGERRISIERIIPPDLAFPLSEPWAKAVAAYRGATDLPYRKDPATLLHRQQRQRVIKIFEDLLGKLTRMPINIDREYLSALLREADDCIDRNDHGAAVARLEAVLSSVHKLLLRYSPGIICENILDEDDENELRAKVLIVEDNKLVAILLKELICKDFPVDVIICKSQRRALKALLRRDVSLIILDNMLPDVSGAEILRIIKMSGIGIPVVSVSAVIDEDEARSLGFSDGLQKPVSADKFRAILEKHLSRVGVFRQSVPTAEGRKSISL